MNAFDFSTGEFIRLRKRRPSFRQHLTSNRKAMNFRNGSSSKISKTDRQVISKAKEVLYRSSVSTAALCIELNLETT